MKYLKLLRHPTARGVAACFAAASLGGVVSFLANRPVAHAATQIASAPFSAITVQSFFDPEGKLSFKESREYYRFSDWSIASRGTEIYPEKRQLLGGAMDLALEHDLIFEPITRSVITMKKTRAEMLSLLTGMEDETCPDDSDDVVAFEPGGLILGYATTHVTTRNCLKEDRWLIPKLRCFAVKEIDRFSDGGWNEFETISLIEGEPSRSLLSAPSDYVERSPAEAVKAFAVVRGGEELFESRQLAVLTKAYAAGR